MKPKYTIGDRVWIIDEGKAVEREITLIALYDGKIVYDFERYAPGGFHNRVDLTYGVFEEENVFTSKEELIASL